MRGKVITATAKGYALRITPAYAGKSIIKCIAELNLQDHPRLCGEKRKVQGILQRVWGSPPPMRGKAHNLVVLWQNYRITPAYAGKS